MAAGIGLLRGLARILPGGALRAFGRPVALHFHGVARQIDDPRIQINQHARDDFYGIAKALKADFQVLPLAAIGDVLKAPERHARSVFLMSDDGYRNTLTDAADVLDGLGLPWTLFVSTHHIDTGEFNPFVAARLFFFFAPAGRYALPHWGKDIELKEHDTRPRAAAAGLRRLRLLDPIAGAHAVDAMLAALPPPLLARLKERFASERFLNWAEVSTLAGRGVEIGSHGHHHWPMHRGREAGDLLAEARISRARIEHQIGPCRFFAYPFGHTADVSREAWMAVRDAGYSHAFTTLSGSLDGGANPWLLPRYALRPGDRDLATLAPLLRAGNRRLAHWQKRRA